MSSNPIEQKNLPYQSLTITPIPIAGLKGKAYFVASTASLNVEGQMKFNNADVEAEQETDCRISPDERVWEIARYLMKWDEPSLVTLVHGFSNNDGTVYRRFKSGLKFIAEANAANNRPDVVYIGFQWPSETVGEGPRNILGGIPSSMGWFTYFLLMLVPPVAWGLFSTIKHLSQQHSLLREAQVGLIALASALIALGLSALLTLWILRRIIYYRDGFRARNYGVPDLLDFFRHLHFQLNKVGKKSGKTEAELKKWRINTSFVAHSMGAMVVTELIRIMTNVFDDDFIPPLRPEQSGQQAWDTGSNPADNSDRQARKQKEEIDDWFFLKRLALVSPDISAEALLLRPSNFLRVALNRFEEAYLFSNEGDAVLRNISTIGNYFTFPTCRQSRGHRLGDVEVIAGKDPGPRRYGVVNSLVNLMGGDATFFKSLRVGRMTLTELNEQGIAQQAKQEKTEPAQQAKQKEMKTAQMIQQKELKTNNFSFFEMTDYIDECDRPVLTFSKQKAKLTTTDNTRLLWAYFKKSFGWRGGIDVHSGYFDSAFSSQLIYTAATCGWKGLAESLLDECEARRARVLLAPDTYRAYKMFKEEQAKAGEKGGATGRVARRNRVEA